MHRIVQDDPENLIDAVKLGAVNREIPLDKIAYEIVVYGGGR